MGMWPLSTGIPVGKAAGCFGIDRIRLALTRPSGSSMTYTSTVKRQGLSVAATSKAMRPRALHGSLSAGVSDGPLTAVRSARHCLVAVPVCSSPMFRHPARLDVEPLTGAATRRNGP